jgi:hypothetical protein
MRLMLFISLIPARIAVTKNVKGKKLMERNSRSVFSARHSSYNSSYPLWIAFAFTQVLEGGKHASLSTTILYLFIKSLNYQPMQK